ncbi:MAG: Gfo/Idh/MocA family protein [Lysobacterales bacterium]
MAAKIRLGILGTGNMAHQFARACQYAENIELVAVASRSRGSAGQFALEFDLPKHYSAYQTLAADPAIDLVYVSTPHSCHVENSLMCLEAGKAVICEKPFAINAREAGLMIERARAKKLFLMEAMWTRYVPAVVRLRDLLAENAIGKVQLMIAGGAYIPAFNSDSYLFRPELGGGVLLDAGVYLVSLASMIFGTPGKILATGSMGEGVVDDHDAILLQHENDAIASLYVSLRASASPDLSLLGDLGKIYLHPPIFAPRALTLSIKGKADELIELPFPGNGYQFELNEAAQCILEGKTESAIMPLDETLAIMHTMDEARRQMGVKYPVE